MLLLAFAVFSWGVQYKLSLYHPPAKASAHMAEAKLLSNKERPVQCNAPELAVAFIAQPVLTVVFACLAGALLVGLDLFGYIYAQTDVRDNAQIPKQPSQSFFFFRPPPVILSSK